MAETLMLRPPLVNVQLKVDGVQVGEVMFGYTVPEIVSFRVSPTINWFARVIDKMIGYVLPQYLRLAYAVVRILALATVKSGSPFCIS